MKKLIHIIVVLVLALILSSTPACGKAVPAAEVQETTAEEATEEVAPTPEVLFEACIKGNLEEIERLLGQGVDVNATDNFGMTALMYAADLGRTDIAGLLIDNGADVNAVDNYGRTALMHAIDNGHTETAKLLKEKGATE